MYETRALQSVQVGTTWHKNQAVVPVSAEPQVSSGSIQLKHALEQYPQQLSPPNTEAEQSRGSQKAT
jgi:hypothetical protein